MKRLVIAAAIAGLGLSACAKNDGQQEGTQERQVRERISDAAERLADRATEEVKSWSEQRAREELLILSVEEARGQAIQHQGTTFVDVNTPEDRQQYGTIHGALLLTDANDLPSLPENKESHLIFYAKDTSSSSGAIATALAGAAGYSNASLMIDGIAGWSAEGYTTEEYVVTARDELAPQVAAISVRTLEQGIQAGTHQAVDVNGPGTRAEFGKVQGAILLSGVDYEEGELPADKASKLAFYCSSPACTAAPRAAARALADGYENVFVLVPGISGWVAGNGPVDAVE